MISQLTDLSRQLTWGPAHPSSTTTLLIWFAIRPQVVSTLWTRIGSWRSGTLSKTWACHRSVFQSALMREVKITSECTLRIPSTMPSHVSWACLIIINKSWLLTPLVLMVASCSLIPFHSQSWRKSSLDTKITRSPNAYGNPFHTWNRCSKTSSQTLESPSLTFLQTSLTRQVGQLRSRTLFWSSHSLTTPRILMISYRSA